MPESPDLLRDVQYIKHKIKSNVYLLEQLLTLEKDALQTRVLAVFVGKRRPKQALIKVYLAGDGRSREEISEHTGLSGGTVRPYVKKLEEEGLIEVREVRDGVEILGWTMIERVLKLSRKLQAMLGTSNE